MKPSIFTESSRLAGKPFPHPAELQTNQQQKLAVENTAEGNSMKLSQHLCIPKEIWPCAEPNQFLVYWLLQVIMTGKEPEATSAIMFHLSSPQQEFCRHKDSSFYVISISALHRENSDFRYFGLHAKTAFVGACVGYEQGQAKCHSSQQNKNSVSCTHQHCKEMD